MLILIYQFQVLGIVSYIGKFSAVPFDSHACIEMQKAVDLQGCDAAGVFSVSSAALSRRVRRHSSFLLHGAVFHWVFHIRLVITYQNKWSYQNEE